VKEFEYLEPKTVAEAVKLLAEKGSAARVMAGGTDLMVELNAGHNSPQFVVYIGGLKELKFIKEEAGKIKIGALTTHAEAARSPLLQQKATALAEACAQVGAPQTRNLGTIAGNISWASPAADSAPALMALGAKVKIASAKGERQIAIEDFFTGVNKTVLQPGELITEIELPASPGSAFLKLGKRRAMATSLVSVAAAVEVAGGKVKEGKVALGAVAPTPVRAKNVEGLLAGKDASALTEVAAKVTSDISPITDGRAPAWYRLDVSKVLVRRALESAIARATGR
jgi:CO/xanthine dehydrogenase FAD-binding subunit